MCVICTSTRSPRKHSIRGYFRFENVSFLVLREATIYFFSSKIWKKVRVRCYVCMYVCVCIQLYMSVPTRGDSPTAPAGSASPRRTRSRSFGLKGPRPNSHIETRGGELSAIFLFSQRQAARQCHRVRFLWFFRVFFMLCFVQYSNQLVRRCFYICIFSYRPSFHC